VNEQPLILSTSSSSEYILPDTLTAQAGIELLENVIRSKQNEPFGKSQEEIALDLIGMVEESASDALYDKNDIVNIENYTTDDIKKFFNESMEIQYLGESTGGVSELTLLTQYLEGDLEAQKLLAKKARNFLLRRDATLKLPVPKIFSEEHLGLLNVYNALYINIESMAELETDPLLTLARLKRHQDDATGLVSTLDQYFKLFFPYSYLFTEADSGHSFWLYRPINFEV
jgi:hypothetical protein